MTVESLVFEITAASSLSSKALCHTRLKTLLTSPKMTENDPDFLSSIKGMGESTIQISKLIDCGIAGYKS